uniref:nitric oxide dioxygenase n=1 Tax=Saitozyma podzolica TaxID=1890683 RepID=A0AA49Q9I7_9TREE|nr:flavohemoglobin [Saitozyma podzolica]
MSLSLPVRLVARAPAPRSLLGARILVVGREPCRRLFSSTPAARLTQPQKDIVKATVPILETGGEALTTHFYHLLLNNHPEVKPLFNQAHQGSGRQPRALAASILAYAKNIDDLTPLLDAVRRITNKHAALQILPEHYPLVGASLLGAIRDVLGEEVATEEVLEAWGAAYGELADLLIKKEENIYHDLESARGGWRGGRKFTVAQKVPETGIMTSFYLEPVDGRPILRHDAGQYIGLRAIVNGVEQRRNYSLSDSANDKYLRISVKREPGGAFSNYLHDRVKIGDELEVYPPVGEFVLDKSRADDPLILISAGAGITPTIPMLQSALEAGRRQITFIHCARAEDVHAFRPITTELAKQNPDTVKVYTVYETKDPHHVADATGMLSLDKLKSWLPHASQADIYFLGPKPFMKGVNFYLKSMGGPEDRIHYEFFGPAEELEDNKEVPEKSAKA